MYSGGEEVLLDVAGQEATEAFEDVGHSDEAREILAKLEVGDLKRVVCVFSLSDFLFLSVFDLPAHFRCSSPETQSPSQARAHLMPVPTVHPLTWRLGCTLLLFLVERLRMACTSIFRSRKPPASNRHGCACQSPFVCCSFFFFSLNNNKRFARYACPAMNASMYSI